MTILDQLAEHARYRVAVDKEDLKTLKTDGILNLPNSNNSTDKIDAKFYNERINIKGVYDDEGHNAGDIYEICNKRIKEASENI